MIKKEKKGQEIGQIQGRSSCERRCKNRKVGRVEKDREGKKGQGGWSSEMDCLEMDEVGREGEVRLNNKGIEEMDGRRCGEKYETETRERLRMDGEGGEAKINDEGIEGRISMGGRGDGRVWMDDDMVKTLVDMFYSKRKERSARMDEWKEARRVRMDRGDTVMGLNYWRVEGKVKVYMHVKRRAEGYVRGWHNEKNNVRSKIP